MIHDFSVLNRLVIKLKLRTPNFYYVASKSSSYKGEDFDFAEKGVYCFPFPDLKMACLQVIQKI